MSYLGNSPPSQNFVAGADQFSGTGSQTVFTLSRNVNTVFDIFVTVSNVPQDPFTAYTVAGNTLTFDGAPPSGTNNIDVVYRATNVQTFVPTPGVSTQLGLGSASAPSLTFIGDTNTGIYSPAADTIAFAEGGTEIARFDSSGNFGLGTSSPGAKLHVSQGNTSVGALFNGTTRAIRFGFDTTGSIIEGVDNTGVTSFQPLTVGGVDVRFTTGSASQAERMRITSSGNVGIGTNAPGQRVTISDSAQSNQLGLTGSQQNAMQFLNAAGGAGFIVGRSLTVNNANDFFIFDAVANANRLGIDVNGNLQFNSGYGSAATAYGCRAWVNFNGTGTVAISASGNVSSITDNGVGDYTVNFTNAMPDVNYCACGMFRNSNFLAGGRIYSTLTGSVSFNNSTSANVAVDSAVLGIAIFR